MDVKSITSALLPLTLAIAPVTAPALTFAAILAMGGCTSPSSLPSPRASGRDVTPPSAEPAASTAASSSTTEAMAKTGLHAMYRFDFSFASTEVGKPTSTTLYTMNVEENSTGEIRLGHNVPLQAMPTASGSAVGSTPSAPHMMVAPRQDVGLSLRCSFTLSPASNPATTTTANTSNTSSDELLLKSNLELSAVDPSSSPPQGHSIQKLEMRGNALVSPGKTSVVASSEDPTTHQRYQLSVTATRLH